MTKHSKRSSHDFRRLLFPTDPGEIRFIDTETRSSCPIKYGPRAQTAAGIEIICTFEVGEGDDAPRQIVEVDPDVTYVSWGEYDFAVLTPIWSVNPRWIDASAVARFLGLPGSLEDCAFVLGLPGKDAEGRWLINRYCEPGRHEDEIPTQHALLFNQYCARDVVLLREIWSKYLYPYYPEFLRYGAELAALSIEINTRGIGVDTAALKTAIPLLEVEQKALITRFRGILEPHRKKYCADTGKSLGVEIGPNSNIVRWFLGLRSLAQKETTGISFPNDPDKQEVWDLRQHLAGQVRNKIETMLAKSVDGRLHDELRFFGARTGRFSARGAQIQNVKRSEANEDFFTALTNGEAIQDIHAAAAKNIRGFIRARAGHELIVVDFTGIEGRIVAWLAEDDELLDSFLNGDPYVDTAQAVLGKSEISQEERQLGKTIHLACQYGAGAIPVRARVLSFRPDYTEWDAQDAVDAFRRRWPSIPNAWRRCEIALSSAMQYPDLEYSVGERLQIWRGERWLHVRLPSGRLLRFLHPTIDFIPEDRRTAMQFTWGTKRVESGRGELKSTIYGSKIFQNAAQAIGADILATAMIAVARSGYRIVNTIHDEVLIEAPIGTASIEEIKRLMTVVPEWAPGLFLDADGYVGERYKK